VVFTLAANPRACPLKNYPPNDELERLAREYRAAIAHYEWAVSELGRRMKDRDIEFRRHLYRSVEDAREKCRKLKVALKAMWR